MPNYQLTIIVGTLLLHGAYSLPTPSILDEVIADSPDFELDIELDMITPDIEKLIRDDRSALVPRIPMCTSKMSVINRQARFAAVLLTNKYSPRTSRATMGAGIFKQDVGVFCKHLWAKLKRVHAAVTLIEENLIIQYGDEHVSLLTNTIQQLKESLQEQMNESGTHYNASDFEKPHKTKKRNKAIIANRAEVILDQLVSTLDQLATGCQRLKRNAYRYRN